MLTLLFLGIILAIYLSRIWVSKPNDQPIYDVVVSVDNRIRNAIQSSLEQYKQDLANEELTYFQYNVTVDGLDASSFRANLTEFWNNHNVKGCVLVGDFPYAKWEEGVHLGPEGHYPTDYYYMDLDGEWNDTDGDGAYDEHTGDIAPEIWCGRIKASNVNGTETELINNYFQKNHDYRVNAGCPTWPRRALAYMDISIVNARPMLGNFTVYRGIVENTTICLEKAYDNVTTVYYTSPYGMKINATDYMYRLNSTEGYEWVWLGCHGWFAEGGFHQFSGGEDPVYFHFYLENSPKAFFYIWDVCKAAAFHKSNCLGSSAIFGNGWGLISIGATYGTPVQCQFFEFFERLNQSQCIGEAFKTFWNSTIDGWTQKISYEESKKWVLLGDPTLCVSTPD